MVTAILLTWFLFCVLGVLCTWLLKAKAAGFVLSFFIVACCWVAVWAVRCSGADLASVLHWVV